MNFKEVTITNDMIQAAGQPVAKAIQIQGLKGLLFLETIGGLFKVYNTDRKQALRHEFDSVAKAKQFLISKGILQEVN